MEERALELYGQGALVNIEDYAMSADVLVKQVALIQDVMKKVMQVDEHYGKIPGTKKDCLYKPGAEKLCLVFRLNPDYAIIMQDREDFFISYTVKCTLSHIPTGQVIASGVGACNSKETKYRYRYIEESTGQPVPKDYWKAKSAGESKEMKRLLGGDGFRAAKIDDVWVIAKSEKIENDNPYDLDNTLLKMACKRALVAATLNATAASDIFTQDLEDMPPLGNSRPTGTEKKKPSTVQSASGDKASEKQVKAIYGILKGLEIPSDKAAPYVKDLLGLPHLDKIESLTKKQASDCIGKLQNKGNGESDLPDGCTKDPKNCPNASWDGETPFCGPELADCQFNKG